MNKNLKRLLSALCAITVTFSAVSFPMSADETEADAAAISDEQTAADTEETEIPEETEKAPETDGIPFEELERIEGTAWETEFTEKDGVLTWKDPDPSLYPVNPTPELWEVIAEYEVYVNDKKIYNTATGFEAAWDSEIGDNVLTGNIYYAEAYLPAIISKYVHDGGDTTGGAIVSIKAHKTPKDDDTSVVIDSCTTTFDASKYIGQQSDTLLKPLVSGRAEIYDGAGNFFLSAGGSGNAAAYAFESRNVYSEGDVQFEYVYADKTDFAQTGFWWLPNDIKSDFVFTAYAVDADGNYSPLSPEIAINHSTGKVTKAVPEAIASLPTWKADISYNDDGWLYARVPEDGNKADYDRPYGKFYYILTDGSGNIVAALPGREEWVNRETGELWSGGDCWTMPAMYYTSYSLKNPDTPLNGVYDMFVGFDSDNDGKVDEVSDTSTLFSYNGVGKNPDIEQPGVKQSDVQKGDDPFYTWLSLPESNDNTVFQGYIVEYRFSIDKDRDYDEVVQGGGVIDLWFDGEEQDITVRITPVDPFGNIGEWEEVTFHVGKQMEKWDPNFRFDEENGILTWDNAVTEGNDSYNYRIYDTKSGFEFYWWVQPEWDEELQKNVMPAPTLCLPQVLAEFAFARGTDCAGTYELTIETHTDWDDKFYKATKTFSYTYGGLSTNTELQPRVFFASSYFTQYNREFPYFTEVYMGARNKYTKENVVGYIYDFGIESDGYVNTKEKPTSVKVYAVDKNGKISAPVTAEVLDNQYPELGFVYGDDFENLDFSRWNYSKNIADEHYLDQFDITKAAKYEFVMRADPTRLTDLFAGAVILSSYENGWQQVNFEGVEDPENGLFSYTDEYRTIQIKPGAEKGTYVISADISAFNPYYGKDPSTVEPDYTSMTLMIWANDENPAFTGTGITIEQANIYDSEDNLLIRFDNGGHPFTAPRNYNLEDGNATAYLSFNKVYGADHYDIYQDGVKVRTIEQFEEHRTTVVINDLENDRENGYRFKVAAVSKDGIERFTEEYECHPNTWQGVGISYLDAKDEWQWISGPSEGKDFANIDEALAYTSNLNTKNINIYVKEKSDEIKTTKSLPAGFEHISINTSPGATITVSAKNLTVPKNLSLDISGNVLFAGKVTINTNEGCDLILDTNLVQTAGTAITVKGKKSHFVNINGFGNIAAISGFDDMSIHNSTVTGAVKGGHLGTDNTLYKGAVTLSEGLDDGSNCTFEKAVKADKNVMINGAVMKAALTSQGTVDAHNCTLNAVTVTGKKLTSLKWDDGNDVIALFENCTLGKVTSELKTHLNLSQCKVNGAVTSKGGLHIGSHDNNDPTTITGNITSSDWLNIYSAKVTGKVSADGDIDIQDSEVKGTVTGKKSIRVEASRTDAVTTTCKDAESNVNIGLSEINGKLTVANSRTTVIDSSITGAVTCKGIFEFYGTDTQGEAPICKIGGNVTLSGNTGKSIIYSAQIAGKLSSSSDLEIGNVIAMKGVSAKNTLTVSNSDVYDAVAAATLSTNWGGTFRFVSLSISKGGFVKSAEHPDWALTLELIDKRTQKAVTLTPNTRNNTVAKKFVGSIEGLLISGANCNGGVLSVEKGKLIVVEGGK